MNKNAIAYVNAVISLFKGVPFVSFVKGGESAIDDAKMIRHGIAVAPGAKSALPQIGEFAEAIIKAHGYDLAKMNNGLHKSFAKVKDADPMQLFIEQSLHYLSVYFQNGLDDKSAEAVNSDFVYIPAEELEIEGDPVRVTVIRALSEKEIVARAKALLSGMALSEATQSSLMSIVRYVGADKFSYSEIKNKEFRIRMTEELGIMPDRAGELLRYIVYRKTGLPMLVHSKRSVHAVVSNPKGYNSAKIIGEFVAKNGVEAIAREFNRHRDFWIVLKKDKGGVESVINKAARLAATLNKPAKIGVLDRIGDKSVTLAEVQQELSKVTLWKKVSLANSLLRRSVDSTASLFTVRTGRSYSKQSATVGEEFMTEERKRIKDAVIASIVEEVRPAVEGKKVFLPDGVDYAFPTSEKQFVGCVPFFTTMDLARRGIVGIHWENVKGVDGGEERVDLDLHYTSAKRHVGWNTGWDDAARTEVLHSGDLVNAPINKGGASEAFYLPEEMGDDFAAMSVNIYTDNTVPVPYSMFIGAPKDGEKLSKKSLISARDLGVSINGLEASNKEDLLGFVESSEDGTKKFHFAKFGLGTSIVSQYDENKKAALEAVKVTLATRLSLREVLEKAGAVFEKGEDEEWDINLALEALTKDSFAFLMPNGEK